MRLLLLVLLTFTCTFSFGKTGHRIVGEIAEHYLNDTSRKKIKELIGHTNIAMVSNWADFIKSDKNWKHAWDWHFVTVPDGETIESAAGKYDGKLLIKIREFIDVLKNNDSTKKGKVVALKFLVHLIGDLHQPLHVGNGKDKGGNTVKVEWFRSKTNLHRVWDTHLIDDQKMSYSEYAKYLEDITSEESIQRWSTLDIDTWANESMLLRKQIYNIGDGNLYYPYNFKNIKTIEKRLMQAGIRLAKVLNYALAENGEN